MAIEQLSVVYDPGADVFAALWRAGGDWFDFADGVFKTPSADLPIAAVNAAGAGAASFEVAGDITADLIVGQKLRVTGSTGNNGVYTIRAGSAYSAPNTTINVAEAIPDATVDGNINLTATPYVVLTEVEIGTKSRYEGTLNLGTVAPGLVLVSGTLVYGEQLGASPAPLTDDVLQVVPFEAQLGLLGRRRFEVKGTLAIVTTSGVKLQAAAWLLADGQRVPLQDLDPDAECEIAITVFGPPETALVTLDAGDMGAVTANHRFIYEAPDPNVTADSIHFAKAAITLSDPALGDLNVIAGQLDLATDTSFYAAP